MGHITLNFDGQAHFLSEPGRCVHSYQSLAVGGCRPSAREFAYQPSGHISSLSIPTVEWEDTGQLEVCVKACQRIRQEAHHLMLCPFTTIIEQNAREVRNLLEDEVNILEHHSNVVGRTSDDDEKEDGVITASQRLRLARDNWSVLLFLPPWCSFLMCSMRRK